MVEKIMIVMTLRGLCISLWHASQIQSWFGPRLDSRSPAMLCQTHGDQGLEYQKIWYHTSHSLWSAGKVDGVNLAVLLFEEYGYSNRVEAGTIYNINEWN